MEIIDIPEFIKKKITLREESLFLSDLKRYDEELHKKISGTKILVIGGAGTIGSSFIKAALRYQPSKLVVVDTNENGLTELTRDLRSSNDLDVPEDYLSYPMNFGDSVFEKMFREEGPFEIVANFAAHKHVRSEKDRYSVEAMIENNVFKAQKLLEILRTAPPDHFFCVSTDKATNPVNVMGASKKLMEEVIMSYSKILPITTARFANVAFSNGSLLAGYLERIWKKQPISCPADVRRFFVSPEESGQICLIACMLGKSGEIFFPKLNENQLVSFKHITEAFFDELSIPIKLTSTEKEAKEHRDYKTAYPVYFFKTDTSGEKLYEEFHTDDDEVNLNDYAGIGVIKNAPTPSSEAINTCIHNLKSLMSQPEIDKSQIVAEMKNYLNNFDHTETGKNLDQKM